MNLREIEALAKALVPVIRRFVAGLLDPVEQRLHALEVRQPEKGEPGRDGVDGKDGAAGRDGADGKSVTPDDVLPTLQAELKALVEAIPVPKDGVDGKDGRDGVDGKSVTIEDVLPSIQAEVKALIEAIPAPKDGADGKDGRDGIDGKSVTIDEVLPALQIEVKQLVEAIPAPRDGKDGRDGEPGRDGVDGKSVTVADVQQLLVEVNETTFAKWALDFERRAMDMMERAIDRMPKPANGKDGRDGFGFDDMLVEHDGIGGVTLRFARGDETKEFSLQLPVFVDRGVWREDTKNYKQGNGVTFGGSFYIAQKDNPVGKPGEASDWRLAVKKGRDGRNAA